MMCEDTSNVVTHNDERHATNVATHDVETFISTVETHDVCRHEQCGNT